MATVKVLVLACVLGLALAGDNDHRGDGPVNASAPVVAQNSVPSSKEPASNSAEVASGPEPWYGKELDMEDVQGCKWPSDFDRRFSFCANRSGVSSTFSIGAVGGSEFGLLNKDIASQMLEKCSSGDCSGAKINQTDLSERAELWWQHMDSVSAFSGCLKKNTEGMVRLCSGNDAVAQTVSGIAGLHLNLIDALATIHQRVNESANRTEACLAKLSEAVHFTGAAYLTSRFYSKNTVLCWDVTGSVCNPLCKQFAYILTCLQSVCPISPFDSKHFGIWEWFFKDTGHAKEVCNVQVDDGQCQSDTATMLSKASLTREPTDLLGKSKAVLEKAKEKFHEFENTVEQYTHLKFFQVALIVGGTLAAFVGSVTLFCMWYHGLLCQRRKRRVLRYSKLVPDDRMGIKNDESKLLTRDYRMTMWSSRMTTSIEFVVVSVKFMVLCFRNACKVRDMAKITF